jgi:hypothetical protein
MVTTLMQPRCAHDPQLACATPVGDAGHPELSGISDRPGSSDLDKPIALNNR